ncbi:MAG: hypothetical protein NW226_09315 [Microscillaceae bacterium]|nr:hypothetical protein [Microscillaceae bacterium]
MTIQYLENVMRPILKRGGRLLPYATCMEADIEKSMRYFESFDRYFIVEVDKKAQKAIIYQVRISTTIE